MAPLSPQTTMGGTVTRTPRRPNLRRYSARSSGFAATPPPTQKSATPVSSTAAIAFDTWTSMTAASNDAARSGRLMGRPALFSPSMYVMTAVFRPERLKR